MHDDREADSLPEISDDALHTRFSCDEPPSEAVVRALAAVKGVKLTELDVLYETIDPEALDNLMGDPVVDSDTRNLVVEFTVSPYRVTVRDNGSITLLVETDEE
ncbi:HalOD1 output domain-containing protein [Halomicrococcus sp. NG-SE-24]|uniref:HalOD1 output domain-containing protein n=1 Tax=Halomicrococcus sp. NG-SE-24 TaxID=3436928 RepID=UPI003D98FFBC